MLRVLTVLACLLLGPSASQYAASRRSSPPVPILRQVSTSHDDGSYTYGYEAGDGSFKLETRRADGEVFGKYGYIDGSGELRTVEYGANRLGFQPSGAGITVAPPTLVDETRRYRDDGENRRYDDGQYRRYYDNGGYRRDAALVGPWGEGADGCTTVDP
ncbi:larval cuticle protein 1-like [Pollicipes pollicipes]|uniref:larval cuticle protein 1-like n=1 Tax=Pollicipes pollicipes TaxID=41117 RepID=UPI0018856DDD|nr:larval cuticle protein 1-like [Pollicipes pollicipes]